MFHQLQTIAARPEPFQYYTASDLWTDEHTAKQMLQYHLDPDVDISSRKISFINRSVAWIAEHFALDGGKRVADFGCGPGLYTNRLARTGAKVTGVDFSANSLEYAKEQAEKDGLGIRYVHQNYLEFESEERFDLITMIMCDFCVFSPSQRRQMLTKFGKLLVSGGALLFDAYSLAAFEARDESQSFEAYPEGGFWSKDPYFEFLNHFKYEEDKVCLSKYTIIEKDRTRTIYNWLQYFSIAPLTAEFEAAGFRIEAVLGNVAGGAYDPQAAEFAVIARKK